MIGSITDWVILIVVVVVLFAGASKIPELARAFGRAKGEYEKARMEVQRELAAAQAQPQQPLQPQQSKQELNSKIEQLEKELAELKKKAESQ